MKSHLTLVLLLVATSALGAIRSPKHAEFIKTLGQPMVAYSPGTTTQATAYLLAWDYGTHGTNIVFEVYRSADLQTWAYWATAIDTAIPIDTSGQCGFFKVRAKDIETGLTSGWNQ